MRSTPGEGRRRRGPSPDRAERDLSSPKGRGGASGADEGSFGCNAAREAAKSGRKGIVAAVPPLGDRLLHGNLAKRTFHVVLIKPSHYDADGYVIQWWRSTLPSNCLASVYGLLRGMRRRPRARPRRQYRSRGLRRVQYRGRCARHRKAHSRRRRRHGRPDRRAVEPISARARSRPAVPHAAACRW